jgi:hypothetical protein
MGYMVTAKDSAPLTVPAIEAIAGLKEKKRRAPRNGPVINRNHLEALSPSLRDYVLDRCRRRGIPVTSVRVISPTEVIIP